MTPLEVEYKVSLHEAGHDGRWNINKDLGTITSNLPRLYSRSEKTVTKYWKDTPNNLSSIWKGQDDIIDLFTQHLIETEMVERICIERAYQKIRLKGRSRCKPFCCVEKPALLRVYPDEWIQIKGFIQEQIVESGL